MSRSGKIIIIIILSRAAANNHIMHPSNQSQNQASNKNKHLT
jgi:hypothetical protein